MNALDSAYEWGVTPQNAKNLSQKQLVGLSSLAPQGGYGLGTDAPQTALHPYVGLPKPQFAPNATDAFNFEQSAFDNATNNLFLSQVGHDKDANPSPFPQLKATPYSPTNPNGTPAEKPYFDPNSPYESMLALKDWLAPQIQSNVSPGMNARGINYSGLNGVAGSRANDYLSQLAPTGETPDQALSYDMDYMYGPNIANDLVGGYGGTGGMGYNYQGTLPKGETERQGNIFFPPSMPNGIKFGDGTTNAHAQIVNNPEYSPGASVPQFGLYDLGLGGTQYAGPGYLYDPQKAPDASKMPWLANATYPTVGA